MKRKEFVVLPKHLILGMLIFIAIAIFGYAFLPKAVAWVMAPKPAEIAARDGAQAFLSTDVKKGQAAWEDGICNVATEQGCMLIKKTIAPMLWPSIERSKIQQSCLIVGSSLSKDIPAGNENPHTEAWLVTLECTNLQTGKIQKGDIQVLVSEFQGSWKFERVLFNQESQHVKP